MATESAVILTIFDADKMTKSGKKHIAKWLCKQADVLIEDGHLYAKRCTIRYIINQNNIKEQ